MATTLDILIKARDEATAVINNVTKAGTKLGSTASTMSQKLSSVGGMLTKTLTPAAAAAAVVFAKAGHDWDEAVRTLTAGNPAKVVQDLLESAKKVGGQVTQPINAVAEALDTVSDRTGLTGRKLQGLTKQFLQLEHLTGETAASTIPAVTRLFGDWSIKTKDQTDELNALFRASEASGNSVAGLAQSVVQTGAPFRQLGFSLSESIALFADWEQSGVNVTTVAAGMKMGLKNLSAPTADLVKTAKKLGISLDDPQKAFAGFSDAIKKAPTNLAATSLAFKLFGARAGPDMAAAIREGHFEVDKLMHKINEGGATIAKSAEASTSLADKFVMLKNRIMQTIGPFGDIGAAILGGVAAIGPMLLGLGAMGQALKAAGGASKVLSVAMTSIPFVLIAAAVIALTIVIIKNWDTIKAFLLKTWDAIKAAAKFFWDNIAIFIIGPMKLAIDFLIEHWRGFKTAFIAIWNVIKAVIGPIIAAIAGTIRGIVNVIKDLVHWAVTALHALQALNPFAGGGTQAGDIGPKGQVGGSGLRIPAGASGGAVKRTGLALIHAGEQLVPAGAGMGGVTINVYGDVTGDELVRKVEDALTNKLTRGGAIFNGAVRQ